MKALLASLGICLTLAALQGEEMEQQDEETIFDPATRIADLEEDPNAVVNGVNVITGDYTEVASDIIVGAIEHLAFQRSYYSSDRRKSRFGQWEFNHQGSLTDESTGYFNIFKFQDEKGRHVMFRRLKKLEQNYPFRMRPTLYAFLEGYTHCPGESALYPHARAMRMNCYKHSAESIVFSETGDKYLFAATKKNKGRPLEEVHRRNGLRLVYTYDLHGELADVECRNPNNQVLHSLSCRQEHVNGESSLTVQSNDGRKVTYLRRNQTLGKEAFFLENCLEVTSTHVPPLRYSYRTSDRKMVRREGAEGSLLQIEYYEKGEQKIAGEKVFLSGSDSRRGKVKKLREALGERGKLVTTYRFAYDSATKGGAAATRVYDALGRLTLYRYGEDKRLLAIEHYRDQESLYSKEIFTWSLDGKLLARRYEDASGSILYCRHFTYDKRGNLTSEHLYGNLTGECAVAPAVDKRGIPLDNGCEVYRKRYRYSSSHNLLKEESDNRSSTRYKYDPKNGLLVAKYLSDGRKIRLRSFYEYDCNGALTLEIQDDGSSEESSDLTRVTERHIKRFVNRKHAPAGVPKLIVESSLDLSSNQEMVLHTIRRTYDRQGHRTGEEHFDKDGKKAFSLAWEHDAFGNVIKEINAEGHAIKRWYDSAGNLVREVGPDPEKVVKYIYDSAQRLICEEMEGHGLPKRYRYDLCHQKITSTDIYGQETKFVYDPFGRAIETHFPAVCQEDGQLLEPVELKRYNALGHVISTTRADGSVTEIVPNIRGQPLVIKHPDGAIETFSYTLDGLLAKKVAANGTTTHFSYDYQGRVTSREVVDAKGQLLQATSSNYNGFHLTSSTNSAGSLTSYHYDPAGRLETVLENNRKTTYRYDSLGRQSETRLHEEDRVIVKIHRFDLLNRLVEERVEDEQHPFSCSHYRYDLNGRQIQVIADHKSVDTFYNAWGDLLSVKDQHGHTTYTVHRYDYHNDQGQCVAYSETMTPDGIKTIAIRDPLGRLAEQTRYHPLGQKVQRKTYSYDPLGRLIFCKVEGDGQSQATRWSYDVRGRLITLTEANGKTTRYTYNLFGERSSVVKPDGVILHYSYDCLGRIQSLKASDGTVAYLYTYDRNGNICKVEDDVHKLTSHKKFDCRGNCLEELLGNGLSLSIQFDALDRKRHVTLPDRSAIAYEYDGVLLRRVRRLASTGNECYNHLYQLYDPLGQLQEAQLIGNAGRLQIEHDCCGRIVQIGTAFCHASYEYGKTGHLIQSSLEIAGVKKISSYDYNALGQLVEEKMSDRILCYSYDALYNRTGADDKTYRLDGFNQLLDDGDARYKYDLAGRLIERVSQDGIQQYAYDALDRLTTVTEGAIQYRYVYDSEGRRLLKSRYKKEREWVLEESIRYLYLGHSEMAAYQGDVQKELRVLGLGLAVEIGAAVALELEGRVYAPVHDQNGSLICLIDSESGEIAATRRSTAFGIEESDLPWGFASKRRDPETGFVYFGKRYYNPQTGRWITPDPLGYEGGPNLYAYVLNDPLVHFDREGLFLESIGAFVRDSFSFVGNTMRMIGDHLLPIPYLRDAFSSIGRSFSSTPERLRFYSRNHDLGVPEVDPRVRVVAANGILNGKEDAHSLAENISRHFGGVNVHYSYNSSHGFVMDLLECVAQKLGFHTHCEEKLVQLLRQQCGEVGAGGQVYLLSHSQGGLVVSNALGHLTPGERALLHVVTLGSATMIDPTGLGNARNYINSGDPVPWLSDPVGIARHSNHVEILPSALFDHSVLASASYQNVIDKQGRKFQETYRRLR